MNKCKMCGQCCRMIHLQRRDTEWIQKDNISEDAIFIKNNWKYKGTSKEVGGFVRKNDISDIFYDVYECKLITDYNKCSIHENKPRICSGYPWYEKGKTFDSMLWPYPGCGFEKDEKEMRLIEVLKKIAGKKEENENRGKESKRNILPLCKTT